MSVRHRSRHVRGQVRLHALSPRTPRIDLQLVASYEDLQERTADGMFVCQDCRQVVRALVDDGSLCMRCDLLRYPFGPDVSSSVVRLLLR